MEPISQYPKAKLDLTLRCGLEFVYDAPLPAPAIMLLKPQSGPQQIVEAVKKLKRAGGNVAGGILNNVHRTDAHEHGGNMGDILARAAGGSV